MRINFFVILNLLALAAASPVAAAGSTDYLLSDRDLIDFRAMNLAQIQSFLERKGSLAYYYSPDVDGVVKTAAEIISRVAETYNISPKFLLTLLQREQSLVEDKHPQSGQYDWATGFAVCDGCSTDNPDVLAWKGFARQVEGAARQIRNRYLPDLEAKGVTVSGIGPGIAKQIDNVTVVPKNKATAILYTYTPHLTGNLNFASIWRRWFALAYPDGSLVRLDGSKDIWLIQNSERQRFNSRTVFLSRFRDADIIPIRPEDLERYPEAGIIRFANYSLLQTPSGDVYLIDGDSKRRISSSEVFKKLGFNPDEVELASEADLAKYTLAASITLESAYPQGALLQDKKTGGVYWVQDGKKHPIWSKELMRALFGRRTITAVAADQLASFATDEPVRFRDGMLVGVSGQPSVYVIEHGMLRPIVSEAVFRQYGWQWSNVTWTSENVFKLHQLGEPLELPPAGPNAASN